MTPWFICPVCNFIMVSERDLIRQLQQRFPAKAPVRVGIGDDGAVVAGSVKDSVVVTDMLLDGVHFDLQSASPELAGRKSLAVNLSDLAAMACLPTAAFVSVAVPRLHKSADTLVAQIFDGMEDLVHKYGFCIAGGDTNLWDGPLAVNVCLLGQPMNETPVLRSGAVPGDVLCVTGPLGGSLPSDRHLLFEPRLKEAQQIVSSLEVHAMMDISDGLALDLHRMCEAGGTGVTVQADTVPINDDVVATPNRSRLEAALSDGEDFELLAAVSEDSFRTAPQNLLTKIGVITEAEAGCQLQHADGTLSDLPASGWQHS